MSRKFNFNAGPSTMPLPALEKAAAEFVEYRNMGMSLLEATHRGKDYEEVHFGAISLIKEMLGIGDGHKVLFLGGGATLQFAMVPMNLLHGGKTCDLTLTGAWAKKAQSDAKKIGKVNLVFDGAPSNFTTLPRAADVHANPGSAYLHVTSNETIGGVQWQEWPDGGSVPLVVDMSSDFLSRRIPVDRFGLIYAGAQKNLAPAGLTVVIIRNDVLESTPGTLPAYLNYKTHAENDSLYNTPPVFAIYIAKLVLEWVKAQGGMPAIEKLADDRSQLIYDAIDGSGGFYRGPVDRHCRSKMNVVWRLPTEDLEKKFVDEAKAKGMVGLKGHRSVGGCRASIYNAMPLAGAQALASFMADFVKANG